MTSLRYLPAALALAVLGCGYNPGNRAEPTPVNFSVAFPDGKPVRDVICFLLPSTVAQNPAQVVLDAQGKPATAVKLIPGTYGIYFEPASGKAAAYKAIPEKFKTPGGQDVEFTGSGDVKIVLTP